MNTNGSNINANMSFEDDIYALKRKFRLVSREIEYIKEKIYLKDGIFFFKTHRYTCNELLNSPHHARVYNLTEKIGDDAENWFKRGQLSEAGRSQYHASRDESEEELHQVNIEIQRRTPTWWESVKHAMTDFVDTVMRNLPVLKWLTKLPAPVKKMLEHLSKGTVKAVKQLKHLK
jgi:hypothetical protein